MRFKVISASAIESAKGETDQIECPECNNNLKGREETSYKRDNSVRTVTAIYNCSGCGYRAIVKEEFPVIHRAAN